MTEYGRKVVAFTDDPNMSHLLRLVQDYQEACRKLGLDPEHWAPKTDIIAVQIAPPGYTTLGWYLNTGRDGP
jgi:hypothetical protein